MKMVITEADYEETLGGTAVKRLAGKPIEAVLGEDSNTAVIDALPRVFADRVRQMIPASYELLEITIKIQISGNPFGVGIGGDATVKFGPKSKS